MQEYLSDKKRLHRFALNYIEKEEGIEENYKNLINEIINQKISENKNEFRSMLHLINYISNNHNRNMNFFNKIERFLLTYKKEIIKYLSNYDLFKIFETNKKIILFLIENNLLLIDSNIAELINSMDALNYHDFFINEINSYVINENNEMKTNLNDFHKKRQYGENDQIIYQIIRTDSIRDFIVYVNKHDIPLNSTVEPSIFETNSFLINKSPTLIEYAAFFGSIQVFKYLHKNKSNITPLIWIYAIHGNNSELINYLEDVHIMPKNDSFIKCLEEAILCHHNEMIDYIKNNYLHDQFDIDEFISSKSIKYYNYEFIQIDSFNKSNVFNLCQYDYYFIIHYILKNESIDFSFQTKIKDSYSNCLYILTPWQVALINNNIDIAKMLIKSLDINVNEKYTYCCWSKEQKECSILDYLIENRNIDAVQFLLKNEKIDVNMEQFLKRYYDDEIGILEYSLLYKAIDTRCIEIIKLLLSHENINVNSEISYFVSDCNISNDLFHGNNPLLLAIEIENEEIIKLLLDHQQIDVNVIITSDNCDQNSVITPLLNAIKLKNLSIIKILLSNKNINVNLLMDYIDNDKQFKRYIIHELILNNEIEILEFLLAHSDIDVNAIAEEIDMKSYINFEMSALYIAVEFEKEDIVHRLLACPEINVNYISIYTYNSEHNYTPILHNAINKGNINIIKMLLEDSRTDVNLTSFRKKIKKESIEKKKKTTIELAIMNNNPEIIRILLSHPNIDLNINSKYSLLTNQKYYIEEKTSLQISVLENKKKSFQYIVNYLKKNGKLSKNELKELMNIANNENMKTLIYDLL